MRYALFTSALLLTACPPLDDDESPADGGVEGDGAVATPPGDISAHPCAGNRTDALWHDAPSTFYVGCGTTTEGLGLYVSDDLGASWAEVSGFETWRVDDARRSADGRLYVAGRDTVGDARVAVAGDAGPEPVWAATDTASFDVYRFARAADGRAVGESLTGNDILFRADDAADFTVTRDWPADGERYQMLDLALHDGAFYAAGSTITQPPTVFLPGPEHGTFHPVTVAPDRDGELWGLAVTDAAVYAVGVDQDRDVGLIAVSGADPSDADAWTVTALDTLGVEGRSWLRGVCAEGDRVVAVGERQPLRRGNALVLRSDDAGATWRRVDLEDAPNSIQRCVFTDAGVFLAGANGWFGRL